jgi:hypothetical protein
MKFKKIYKTLVGFVVLMLTVSACQKEIPAKDLPQQDPRITLNCTVSRDSLIQVNISSSKSVLSGKDYRMIDDAICEVYINDVYAERLVNIKNGNYKSTIKASSGKKYTIKASASGFKSVEGSSSLPDTTYISRWERYDTTNAHFSKFANMPGYNGPSILNGSVKFKLYVADKPGEDNYYLVRSYLTFYNKQGVVMLENAAASINISISDNTNTGPHSTGTIVYTDDKTVLNKEVLLNVEISSSSNSIANLDSVQSVAVYVRVAAISADLFKYIATVDQQQSIGPNPFAEPVLVYNNITNGMGIVGCASYGSLYLGRYAVRNQ